MQEITDNGGRIYLSTTASDITQIRREDGSVAYKTECVLSNSSRYEEISDYVKVGQIVKVKVLAVNDGKISLSLKQALPREQQKKPQKQKQQQRSQNRQPYKPAPPVKSPGDYEWQSSRKASPSSFEDMMSRFKQTSEDKISDLKRGESRGYSRRGNGNGRR